jgi:NAD(P)-dependent dehydrogenase (short-subunit alcohol dehydrogenase family)
VSALADRGWHVLATVRDIETAKDLAFESTSIDIHQLDLTDSAGLPSQVADILSRRGRLDALINNADIAQFETFEFEPMADFRNVFETNLFGPVALTKLALPWLRRSTGHIVVLSSVTGAIGQPFNEAYCGSKFALEGVFETLQPVAARVGSVSRSSSPDRFRRTSSRASIWRNGSPLPDRTVKYYMRSSPPPPTPNAHRSSRHSRPPTSPRLSARCLSGCLSWVNSTALSSPHVGPILCRHAGTHALICTRSTEAWTHSRQLSRPDKYRP